MATADNWAGKNPRNFAMHAFFLLFLMKYCFKN